MFKPHESMTLVAGGEARKSRVALLVRSTFNIVGDAGVEDVRSAGDDVDVVMVVTLIHARPLTRFIQDTAFLPSGVASSRGLATADLSTALRSGRDDKGESRDDPYLWSGGLATADLSTALRSGRDDKGEGRDGPYLSSGD